MSMNGGNMYPANFRNNCTRVGQFDIALNTWLLMFIILGIGGCLGIFVFINLENIVPNIIRFYLSLLSLLIVEITYLSIIQLYIFIKEKKYILNVLNSYYQKEKNKKVKDILKTIKSLNFQWKYMIEVSLIEKLYNEIKFDEFLELSNINNSDISKKIIDRINIYLKEKNNFKEYIDIAFFGVVAIAILNPIIEYTQSIYIPNTANEFNWINISLFLFTILPFVIIPIFMNHLIHKVNYKKNMKDKKLLFHISEKLNNYDFTLSKIERYSNLVKKKNEI